MLSGGCMSRIDEVEKIELEALNTPLNKNFFSQTTYQVLLRRAFQWAALREQTSPLQQYMDYLPGQICWITGKKEQL